MFYYVCVLEVNIDTDNELTCARIAVDTCVPSRFKTAEIDFGVDAFVLGDGEHIVDSSVEMHAVEPSVEAVAESVAQCQRRQTEVVAVLKIAVRRSLSAGVVDALFLCAVGEHVLSYSDVGHVAIVGAGAVENLVAECWKNALRVQFL